MWEPADCLRKIKLGAERLDGAVPDKKERTGI